MKSLISMAIGAAALLAASSASAAVVADFQLNNSLANAAGGGVTLTNNGATLGATGLTFARNQGPTLTGLGLFNEYTLEIGGSFDAYNGGFQKIADFKDRTSDTGLYALGSALNFYPVRTGASVFSAGTPFVVRLTRDGSSTVRGYVNNVEQFNFVDSGNLAVINSVLHLFRDDFPTGQAESQSGFIDYVTLDGTAIAPSVGGAVPEPAAWGLMIVGFGGVGAMMRRRRVVLA